MGATGWDSLFPGPRQQNVQQTLAKPVAPMNQGFLFRLFLSALYGFP